MMVRPYGNYKFLDYTKFGMPLTIMAQVLAVAMTLALVE